MARFSTGLHVEDRLVTLLERFGCRIQKDEILDHRHLLDFVLLELPEFQTLLAAPIGVQVTGRLGDADKRQRFQERVRTNPYTRRNLYVEIDREADLERGAAFALLVAMAAFALDKTHGAENVRGLRIFSDNSIEFFDLAESAGSPAGIPMRTAAGALAAPRPFPVVVPTPTPAPAAAPAERRASLTPGAPVPDVPPEPEFVHFAPPSFRPPTASPAAHAGPPNPLMGERLARALGREPDNAPRLRGVVSRYNPENLMGVIRSDSGTEYFLHRNNVPDEGLVSLMERLSDEGGQWLGTHNVRVSFRDGGKPYGKKNHIANDIRQAPEEGGGDEEF